VRARKETTVWADDGPGPDCDGRGVDECAVAVDEGSFS
jgi:hypothetical protein